MSGDELRDLYQDVIIDHGKRPRNFHPLADATCTAEGFNPLCGDQLKIYLRLANGVIEDISFQGVGCAISQASASLMTLAVKGKKPAEAQALFARVHTLLTEGPNARVTPAELGKLAVLSGVWEFPVRVKCATLAWHTLRSALEGGASQVTTE
ncbi:SUF system NifU family Fe-S cluster assembly protein [Pseudomonas sp. FW306-02-F02-AA]|uniref:Nitrogen fixation protein NifU n=1 Tax=Pseudomonas fluorescens TaxID=294 RepID=A0A0N9VZJ9_PSEFL|nr:MULTISPECIES: SUF system NifU family Fe-S cluster assembly protein [Pseudomonas]ALI04153.1 nitrogen fixation protein NifU [Pseudomonas fluorescens]PMZ03258.1 SUF system NifU family Fe-S cluster assembly protein [Pseudomonas sp. FW306-02-F02-AB]PMZ07768.1 SUF system NifU family Fe-S cluster assembly protein [Pseudomonas sp. FW306-02-H06C]PMZ13482.1 SUF system NifU family Fe-S cluster assembly protein [Pseudomonas sp. FW306-02-F02-AA]PMZ19725.1 SUF system NifU family Fe-S cluster assembly pro